jgi:hypothetical protein
MISIPFCLDADKQKDSGLSPVLHKSSPLHAPVGRRDNFGRLFLIQAGPGGSDIF